MYKCCGKFHQRMRERGGTVENPFPKPGPYRSGHGEPKKEVPPEVVPARRVREWKMYIEQCRAQGRVPKIPPEILQAL